MLRATIFVAVAFTVSHAVSREIPLSEIASTVSQKNLKYLTGYRMVDGKPVTEDYAGPLNGVLSSQSGASNAFIVDGRNITEALTASGKVVSAFRSASRPEIPEYTPTGSHFLVAFLGCGPSEQATWIVDRVTLEDQVIRLTYREPKAQYVTRDIRHYYYLVPLGSLKDGVYTIELYDADLKSATLVRRVEVKRK
jgi:hypothetical protein